MYFLFERLFIFQFFEKLSKNEKVPPESDSRDRSSLARKPPIRAELLFKLLQRAFKEELYESLFISNALVREKSCRNH